MWTDISPINSQAQERLGYPTQKPEALLERIIGASTDEGDTILDPFCGCGTAIAAAQHMQRQWIGIDITHLAVNLIKWRLSDGFRLRAGRDYSVIGEPTDLAGAKQLAQDERFQFQAWALGLVGARVTDSAKKGADKGIDGRLIFFDEPKSLKGKEIILSVKSGHLKATDLRDLRGVIDREQAQIGVLITLEEPSKPMRIEAASAGFYELHIFREAARYPRLQILTIAELLDGKRIAYPSEDFNITFKRAPKAEPRRPGQQQLTLT